MYESFFQFGARPFVAAPLAGRYFPAQSIENARQTLARVIERTAGPGLLVGPAGIGKSLLCQILADQFRGNHRVAMLGGARLCTRKALLQNILFELGLPYREPDEGNLRLSLMDHLQPTTEFPNGLLLIVDEAHTLPFRLMDELRMIGNVVRDGRARVQIVLAGSPLLDERFTNPKLESFNQRLAARCYLQPLTYGETIEYVRQQVFAVGGNPDRIFTEDALRTVFQASDGIPRIVNQICDHALMLAAAGGRSQINLAGIQEAWADLQQLPAPFPETPAVEQPTTETSGFVEFGQLDDEFVGPTAAYSLPVFDQFETTTPAMNLEEIQLRVAEHDQEAAQWTETKLPMVRSALANGTEVELIFHGAHSPFEDQWAEEEVVVDRYAQIQKSTVPPKPHLHDANDRPQTISLVAARSGAQEEAAAEESPVYDRFASLFENLDDAGHEVAGHNETGHDDAGHDEPVHLPAPSEPVTTEEIPAVAASLAVQTIDPLTIRIDDLPAGQQYAAYQPEVHTLDLSSNAPIPEPVSVLVSSLESPVQTFDPVDESDEAESILRMTRPDDRDLIVVEEPDDEAPRKIEPTSIKEVRVPGRARRQEYRQLFATLRNR